MLKLLTFDKILENASAEFESLSDTRQSALKESLENGKAVLRKDSQMMAYLYFYGRIHKEKLLKAFNHIPLERIKDKISIIDWGCGQGVASIVLAEYLEHHRESHCKITDITLVDPSRACVNKAQGLLLWTVPNALVSCFCNEEHEVNIDDICVQEDTVIHLLSNLVDMTEFSGDGILKYIQAHRFHAHIVVMVSPFYPEEGRGKRMDEFGDRLEGFKLRYSFQKHIDEWEKDYSCQIRIFSNK